MTQKQMLTKLLQANLISQDLLKPKEDERYSSVAIILRNLTSKNTDKESQTNIMLNTQVLLLQRVANGRIYSGQICLPGGKMDEGQTLIQTAIRETYEQTALEMKEKDLIGILKQPFVAYRNKSHALIAYAIIFFLEEAYQIKINPDEISDFRWLPVHYFMKEQVYRPIIVPFSQFSFFKQLSSFKDIDYIQWPAIDVGMKKNLYGLTLYILAFFIKCLEGSLKRVMAKLSMKEKSLQSSPKKEKIESKIQLFKTIEKYGIKFKSQYFDSYRIVWKTDSNLSEAEKEESIRSFNAIFFRMFPERPRL